MQCHKVWRKQCQATRTIRRRFGLKNALDYLVSEKLLNFAEAAEQDLDWVQRYAPGGVLTLHPWKG